jgi:FkbM family methyltransferase
VSLKTGIVRALAAVWPTRRALVWWTMLRELRGRTFVQELGLVVSALVDCTHHAVRPGRTPAPKAMWPLELRASRLGATYHVRGRTDDIYYVAPFREDDAHTAILEALVPGDTFIDVGANIGYYTVLAASRVLPGGTVVAIEPVPATASQLARNLRANAIEGVRLVQAVAGARGGMQAQLVLPEGTFGFASIRASHAEPGERVSAPTVTLDDVCREYSAIRTIKLDVEGAELDVLRGAEEVLRRTERLVLECNEDAHAIRDYLEARGFRVRKLGFTTCILAERVDVLSDRARGGLT